MSNDEGMTKSEYRTRMPGAISSFEHSGFFRHSSFVLRHSPCPRVFVCFVSNKL